MRLVSGRTRLGKEPEECGPLTGGRPMTTTTAEEMTTNAPKHRAVLRVLIVEDHADCAEHGLVAPHLRPRGRDRRSGPATWRWRRPPARPDAARHWPVGDGGFDVARELNGHWGGRRPLIIAVTGFGQEADRRHSADSGIDLHPLVGVHRLVALDRRGRLPVPATAAARAEEQVAAAGHHDQADDHQQGERRRRRRPNRTRRRGPRRARPRHRPSRWPSASARRCR